MTCAVIYEPLPNDPRSGRILWGTSTTAGALALETRPWIPVDVLKPDYDETHKVVDRKLVPIDQ
jgi:hypothetical protein